MRQHFCIAEVWMVDLSAENSNQLFETLTDWEEILKDAKDVYPQTDDQPKVYAPKVQP